MCHLTCPQHQWPHFQRTSHGKGLVQNLGVGAVRLDAPAAAAAAIMPFSNAPTHADFTPPPSRKSCQPRCHWFRRSPHFTPEPLIHCACSFVTTGGSTCRCLIYRCAAAVWCFALAGNAVPQTQADRETGRVKRSSGPIGKSYHVIPQPLSHACICLR